MNNKAVILLSGGLDSTTCLAIAKDQGYSINALTINYGQRHNFELESAKKIANNFEKTFNVKEDDVLSFDGLLKHKNKTPNKYERRIVMVVCYI